MSGKSSRRTFVKASAAAGIGYWVAGGVAPKVSHAANEKIRFACIGIGGKGKSDSEDALKRGDVVAIVDIDEKTLNNGGEKTFKQAKRYTDFRKMYDEVGKSIDAVTVSTPDHTHAPAAIMGMKLGKHCFCQKPLTKSIYEARRMGEIAKEMKLATQMGNQGTANSALREAAALVQSGALGKVAEAHIWTNRPIWAQGGKRPKETPVPTGVNWDLWIGPAPMRPYGAGYHPFAWRGWWDFGTGALGDMACHTFNMPYMALDLKNPTAVEATTSGHDHDSFPKASKIKFEFPANDKRGPVTVWWYDKDNKPDAELFGGDKISASGALIIGEGGKKIYSSDDYCGSYKLIGMDKPADLKFTKSPGHFDEWTNAIKGGPKAMSDFAEYSGGLTETILLGNLAVWVADEAGKKGRVEWNAKDLKVTNGIDVADVIKPKYREGYSI